MRDANGRIYDMRQQLQQGEAAERFIDSMFCEEFEIRPASRDEQRQGIDRIYKRRKDGRELKIEYKADKTAASTNNAFVETVSVDTAGKPGWAYSCQADYILYYIVGVGPLYVLRPRDIRDKLEEWSKYPSRQISNGTYKTHGILVPLEEFEELAVRVFST